ncbi:CGA synthase-related protein [Streptomyces triculaminicus]|uniref:CGA synthase-related protein n=2 Tax=Streptomyces TaxID=1883 RepID=A0A939FNZ8_9ACTN|nr:MULTISPECIES: CGA synthase-related protein [Streptomyces]MBO0654214.1 CGA synthase-related protein [Streptomyces triculaminicus]QSY48883.1 CGA synthase-related protein [Streptomyces griseocarneus]
MDVLNPGGTTPLPRYGSSPLNPAPAAGPRRRVLLVSRDEELDSVLACRRVAAHLGGVATTADAGGAPPDAALVCDDETAARRLLERGVPVVHLRSGHPGTTAACSPDGALSRLHRPGWLPGPWPPGGGARPTGSLAPARTARDRVRAGALLLLSLWGVPDAEAEAFAKGPLRALVRAATDIGGRCEVVGDTRLGLLRSALEEAGEAGRVRLSRAADVDVDALHAAAGAFVASPTLGALVLAHARCAPLTLLPPLGPAQRDLAGRVARALPVPVAGDPGDPSPWTPSGGAAPWSALDPAPDDLRGAQRVARGLRQLTFAPP